MTKNDEKCSQKHELHDTKAIYETFGTTNIKVKEHVHDRKFLCDDTPDVKDSNDARHCAKEVRKTWRKLPKELERILVLHDTLNSRTKALE